MRLACALSRRGDDEGAAMELAAARRVFETAGAQWYLKLCDEAAADSGPAA
jgi:hypothetical protein